jgi:H+/gluconate symporter-like permease
MIDTIYIIGMLIAILGFILFLLAETRIRIIDKEIKKQDELDKSFMKAKQNEKNNINYKHTIIK